MNATISPPGSGRGPATHDIRDQIVVAATEHFSHYGYEKTTVSDLAKAIGFSKAYVYKFFESKQAIGEAICSNCLSQLEQEILQALDGVEQPAERLRRLFKASTEAHQKLLSQDRKLYEIAQSAAAERWPSVLAYEERLRALLQEILQQGRESGDFERKTPLDETTDAIHLVLRPYLNPLLLPHSLEYSDQAPMLLCSLVLRSLSP
ncbi:TetR/AcrR family transcriptional regulator [Pseudoxanthomonas sp. PXM02]|uniref:TetR/AcrR family transcriptional regulator n=1 Tax=Pseudoxanthomonas sp. PXM02 TaxID=2769294 RepID=UPI001782006F|nr:TetR/AcrR family transcriptional regulator [Pseudoxanthomonas sp. PXM02]MBD9480183.1 TetR/AcrR family transcriptional regulator [Pseudoxanthomonas sp. PXM02]